MKKTPEKEQNKETERSASEKSTAALATDLPQTEVSEPEDPMAGLQGALDRFRDLALRSQADFENYKKRAAREKEEAIKYANTALLEKLVAIVDNFELGLAAAKDEGKNSPIYAGMSMVFKQLTDFL